MDRRYAGAGFHFNDDGVLNKQIESVSTVKLYIFVYNRKRPLPLACKAAQGKLVTEAFLIRRFKKPRPQYPTWLFGLLTMISLEHKEL